MTALVPRARRGSAAEAGRPPTVVTGGAGFLGGHLVRALLARGDEVLVLDSAPPVPGRRPRRHRYARVDLRDRPAVRAALAGGAGDVFHLAALHYLPWCEQHPGETWDVNVTGTAALLEVLADLPHRSLVLMSSAAVYGFCDRPLHEQDAPRPHSTYGSSKLAAERLLAEHAARRPDVHAAAARLFNAYGPGSTVAHVVPEVVRAARRAEPLRLGNLWPRRDYVHADDVVRALLRLAAVPAGPGRDVRPLVANVATGRGATVLDLVALVEDLAGRPLEVLVEPERERSDDGHLVGCPDLLQRTTGWRASASLEAGLRGLLAAGAVVRA